MRQVVGRLVVLRMQAKAGNRLRHHAFLGQHDIVGALEEVFCRMRIAYQPCAMLRQRRAREEFGLDPDDAAARDADTVEHYEQ